VWALSSCATLLGLEHEHDEEGADGGTPDVRGVGADGAPLEDAPATGDGYPAPEASQDGGCTWCACEAPDAQFCADFDEPDALAAAGFKVTVEAGALEVVSDEWTSAPNAVVSKISMNSFGSAAFLSRSFPGGPNTRFIVRFDLRVDGCPRAYVTDTLIGLRVNNAYRATLMRTDIDGDAIVVGANMSYANSGLRIRPNEWVTLRFELNTAKGYERAELDDASLEIPTSSFGDPLPESTALLEIGQSAAPANACTLHIDNVTFDAIR
jgi:hypothetical protein